MTDQNVFEIKSGQNPVEWKKYRKLGIFLILLLFAILLLFTSIYIVKESEYKV
ncbi:protease modulator HflC, partial [Bacillus haikouensis]|nr:protease modulator HflC [Bacillus haikouensis]